MPLLIFAHAAVAVVCKASTAREQLAKKVALLSTLPATLAASPAWALVRKRFNSITLCVLGKSGRSLTISWMGS
jgi:hypothetical protein